MVRVVNVKDNMVLIEQAYNQLVEDNLLKTVLHNLHDPSFQDFLESLVESIVVAVLDNNKLVGFAWFPYISENCVICNYTAFKGSFDRAEEYGHLVIDFIFNLEHFTAIMGFIPSVYSHSWHLMERLGCVRLGQVTDACYIAKYDRLVDGYIYKLEKGKYYELRKKVVQ